MQYLFQFGTRSIRRQFIFVVEVVILFFKQRSQILRLRREDTLERCVSVAGALETGERFVSIAGALETGERCVCIAGAIGTGEGCVSIAGTIGTGERCVCTIPSPSLVFFSFILK